LYEAELDVLRHLVARRMHLQVWTRGMHLRSSQYSVQSGCCTHQRRGGWVDKLQYHPLLRTS
jgi:hypothetical protein